MENVNKSRFRQTVSYLMAVLLGMIIGAAVFLFFFGHFLDEKMETITELKAINDDLRGEIKRLKKEDEKNQNDNNQNKLTVKEIEIHIEENDSQDQSLDKVVKLELLTKTRAEIEFLKGKPLEIVSELHDSIRSIFRNKTYEIKDRRIVVEFEGISIYKTVHIWLNAELEN